MAADQESLLGVAFIGAGAVAELHHLALQRWPRTRLTGIYRRDRAACARRAAAWGVTAYGSVDELLGDPSVDAVFVLSPVEDHHTHAIQALRIGKHVLIEKPVSLMAASVREIARVAQAAGRVCMLAHNYHCQGSATDRP